MSGLVQLFSELDRLGPGSTESLRWALGVAGTPETGRVLDAGCGTGADLGTLLSAVPRGAVVGIDRAAEFVERAQARWPRATVQIGDFLDPPGGPFDLIWSAGAVYAVGIAAALAAWRGHLAPGGRIAFSDLRWRGDARPVEVQRHFEQSDGCTLKDVAALEAAIADAGYRLLGSRWLGAPGWASYYGPLEVALDEVEADPDLVATLRGEIALWRTHGVDYGYRLVVVEPL